MQNTRGDSRGEFTHRFESSKKLPEFPPNDSVTFLESPADTITLFVLSHSQKKQHKLLPSRPYDPEKCLTVIFVGAFQVENCNI